MPSFEAGLELRTKATEENVLGSKGWNYLLKGK